MSAHRAVEALLPTDPGALRAAPPPLPALAPLDPRREANRDAPGGWRYRAAFTFLEDSTPVTLAEGFVELERFDAGPGAGSVFLLRDDRNPTGSWKDRGATLLATALRAAGRAGGRLLEDSSGNAAISLAAYARRAGFEMTAFVPQGTGPAKRELIRAAGARLELVPGSRQAATDAAAGAAARGEGYWAAHAIQPLHAAGAATAAFNLVERLGQLPGTVVAPAGNGGLIAGLHLGFDAMRRAGLGAVPAIVAVQSLACPPLYEAWRRGADDAVTAAGTLSGLAEGVLVPRPGRGREVLAAARAGNGAVAAVDDMVLDRALRSLWLAGVKAEATAALPLAWLMARDPLPLPEPVVLVVSGAGVRGGMSLVEGL